MDELIFLERNALYIMGVIGLLYLYIFIRSRTSKKRSTEDLGKSFIQSKEKFLIFKPQVGIKNLDSSYGYFHLKGYDEWNFDKTEMERRFKAISGLCQECQKNPATVGYYDEGYLKGFSDHNEWIIPGSSPKPLCKSCVFAKIRPLLNSFPEGMSRVYGGDGIYISTTTEEQ